MNTHEEAWKAFRAFLTEKGQRTTQVRHSVLEGALSERGHFDADSLYLRLRRSEGKVSRATVYRTLDLLVESGFLSRRLTESQAIYEVARGRGHHDHLVCLACDATLEVFSPELEFAQEALCQRHSFKPLRHTLQIEGLCSACAKKRNQN